MSRSITDAQVARLVDLVIEAASENGEAGGEAPHLTAEHAERNHVQQQCTRARLHTAREALLIVIGVDPHEEPF